MAKYKVGDRVRVRSDLVDEEEYGADCFVEEMEQYKGKNVTIASVVNEDLKEYCILEDSEEWVWTDEMFECLVEEVAEEPHMSAEEVLEWIANNYYDLTICNKIFGVDFAVDEWEKLGFKEIVSKIEAYERNKHVEENEIETEFGVAIRIIEDKNGIKKCVDEKIIKDTTSYSSEIKTIASDYLKEYCRTHKGNFFCSLERNCYVKKGE